MPWIFPSAAHHPLPWILAVKGVTARVWFGLQEEP